MHEVLVQRVLLAQPETQADDQPRVLFVFLGVSERVGPRDLATSWLRDLVDGVFCKF